MSRKESAADVLRHLFFPRRCVGCGTVTEGLSADRPMCPACTAQWKIALGTPCRSCGQRGLLCRCRPKAALQDSAADAFLHLVPYRCEEVQRLLFRIKDHPDRDVTMFLAQQLSPLCAYAKREVLPTVSSGRQEDAWLITVPPRTEKRRLETGTDHAEALARAVSRLTGIPFEKTLARSDNARMQKTLSAADRLENARATCILLPEEDRPCLRGRRVLLLDDVCTTGATLVSCAGLLRAAGAEAVVCVTVARV